MATVTINKHNFREEILNSDKNVLIDFFADWCGPCQRVLPVLEEIARENPDIKVGKINVDEQPELASKFRVYTIPALFAFKNGQLVEQAVGVQTKDRLLAMVK